MPQLTQSLSSILPKIKRHLESGEVVIIPTDLTYVFVAHGYNSQAIIEIHRLKRWQKPQPLALLSNLKKVREFGEVNEDCAKLMAKFPCPINLIIPQKNKLPDIVTDGYKTIFITCPDEISYELVNEIPFPMVCSPAGFSEDYKARNAKIAQQLFGDSVPLIIDGGRCKYEQRATLIDCSLPIPTIMNFGMISFDDLRPIVPNIELPSHLRK